jgi:putative spermidine/putrescine transport system substrate-binding protein
MARQAPLTGKEGVAMTAKLCIAILLAGTAIAQAAHAEELTVATGGGLIADAERAAFFVPTAKALGITFKEETIQNVRDVRIQVQSGAVTWDLAQLGLDECQLAAKEGLLEKIDRSVVSTDGIEATADMDYCIPAYYYSTVLAWNTATGQPMNSWADFFDAEKFPGARSVYKYPRGNLEMALLADGVAPDKLYPLDVDRAFKKLAQLKPEIQAWWDSGAQSAQLLKDGEVDYIQIWNGRASSVIRDGGKAGFTFNQGILTADTFAIPKGALHKATAMKALAMFLSPEQQAHFPLTVDYGPANQKAFATGVLPPERIAQINTSPENAKKQVKLDERWWAENTAAVLERWDNFMQQ